MLSDHTSGLAKTTLIIVIVSSLSSLLGFVRETVIAYKFGATSLTDAYLVALVIPNIFSSFIAGAISVAFIPIFTEHMNMYGEEEAWKIGATFSNLTIMGLILLTCANFLFAPTFIKAIGPGLPSEMQSLSVSLSKYLSPLILLSGLTGLATAIHNSYRKFTVPSYAILLNNIGIIIGAFFLSKYYNIFGLVFGALGGALCNSIIITSTLHRKLRFYCFSPTLIFSPGIKRMASLVVPFIIGSAAGQLNIIIDRIFASGLVEGSISALNYSSRLMQLPLNIFAGAIATVLFPSLSYYAVNGEFRQIKTTLSESIRMLWFITIPMSVGLMVLRKPIISILFEHGAFTSMDTQMTAQALMFYSIGLFAQSGIFILVKCYYSLQDSITPVKIAFLTVIFNILLNFVLVKPLLHSGLALATSVSSILNFLLLLHYLERNIGKMQYREIMHSTIKFLIASTLMGYIAWQLYLCLSIEFGENKLSITLVSVVFGTIAYFIIAYFLKMREIDYILSLSKKLMYNKFFRGDRNDN